MSSQRGFFLAFEGVEGSGKSTQAGLLAETLRGRGVPVVVAREPGETALGERIRSLLLEQEGMEIPAHSELFLFLAARAAFVEQVVRPALAEGRVVIADRFELSTLAYQGAGRGLPVREILRCNRFATGALTPDATVLLELSLGEGTRRQVAARKRPDRMEREELAFHERVSRGYRRLAGSVPGILPVDAEGSLEEVRRRVLEALTARFPETFSPGGVTR